jgi:hypothetical protein
MLDALVGRLSFDPLAFTRLTAREQRQALLDLVNIEEDLAELDSRRAALYRERTEVGRQGKAFGDVPALEPGVPDEEVSAAEVLSRLRAAEAQCRNLEEQLRKQERHQSAIEYWMQQVEEAQAGLDKAVSNYAAQKRLLTELPPPPATSVIEAELAAVESTNRKVRDNKARARAAVEVAELHRRYDSLTTQIDELDSAKSVLLSEAKFPVDGLGFDDTGVIYNGVPFCQASSAEQIRVAMAMAMAANPKLRVLRILDGSLLDAESMAQIAAMAKAADYQCWVERVSDLSETAVLIEDGSVVTR